MAPRILVVNSNTSPMVTDLVAAEARAAAADAAEIVAVTAPFGPRAIESRSEGVIAAHATLQAFAEHRDRIDAGIVACFSDPGLLAARELFDFPVCGINEAAMLMALQLGGRFAIVTVGARVAPVLRELAGVYGVAGRLAAIRTIEARVLDVGRDQDTKVEAFAHEIAAAVDDDGAECVILGGAAMAGIARRLAATTKVPLLDGVACAVQQAIALARLAPPKPARGSYARPAAKEMVGVAPALAALFADPKP